MRLLVGPMSTLPAASHALQGCLYDMPRVVEGSSQGIYARRLPCIAIGYASLILQRTFDFDVVSEVDS
jgi:hypothetical protein